MDAVPIAGPVGFGGKTCCGVWAIGADVGCGLGTVVVEGGVGGSISPSIIAGGTADRPSFWTGGGGAWSFRVSGCDEEDVLTGRLRC